MSSVEKEILGPILEKYNAGTATEAEIRFLEAYYKALGWRPGYTDQLNAVQLDELFFDIKQKIDADIDRGRKVDTAVGGPSEPLILKGRSKFVVLRRWFSAAAVLLCIGAVFYFYQHQGKTELAPNAEIAPGRNTATLTLADGKKITLSAATNGTLAEQVGAEITKTADGQLVYTVVPGKKGGSDQTINPALNKIATARGEQYQVVLPDGSKVWLNAASTLTFPTTFAAQKNRKVELSGEAYFEVAKDKTHPFIVKSGQQEVQVLGTHFNISAYEATSDVKTAAGTTASLTGVKTLTGIKTTLLEGQVKVSSPLAQNQSGNSVVLEPGEQATLTSKSLAVSAVDVRLAVDWKNGEFRFRNEPLPAILDKIARWYDVDIDYVPDAQHIPTFSGSVSRFANVATVLNMLGKASDLRFSIQGRTIKVR